MNPQGFSGDDLMMKTSSPVSSVIMELLPDEVLLKILHHLRPEDLIVASQVSETWNRVARDSTMWKEVALTWRNFPNTAKIQSYVSRILGRFSPLSNRVMTNIDWSDNYLLKLDNTISVLPEQICLHSRVRASSF